MKSVSSCAYSLSPALPSVASTHRHRPKTCYPLSGTKNKLNGEQKYAARDKQRSHPAAAVHIFV